MRGPWEIVLSKGVLCGCSQCMQGTRMKPSHKTLYRKLTRTRRKREAEIIAQEQLSGGVTSDGFE